jgi:CDP-paratose 2-epimerase
MTQVGRRRELQFTQRFDDRPVLVTGGAGFIGTNLAHRIMNEGTPVIVYDNLSRPGVERNLRWLRDVHGTLLRIEIADVRDRPALVRAVRNASHVVHLAAQVAVTTSILDPVHDFEVNALGTLNLLGALNSLDEAPPLLFTSTNKVYGCLEDVELDNDGCRYFPEDERIRRFGISESRPLDFHSPYGCSKGAADQYVLDYARTFGIRAFVFRMSCIYGPHQFGTEDQGWVAHFLIRAMRNEPITLYGDGQQVRDVLFIDDLVDGMMLALDNIHAVNGRAFNVGGGPANTTSLLELVERIGYLRGVPPEVRFGDWRPGDQRYYVSDVERLSAAIGWRPNVDVAAGLHRLHDWLQRSGVPAMAGANDQPWASASTPPAAAAVGD